MLHYELIPLRADAGTHPRIVQLPDDARGADLYLAGKKRGYQLRRVSAGEAEA